MLRNLKAVKVPDVYWDLTTSRILTMEFEEGISIQHVDTIRKEMKVRGLLG